MTNPIFDLDIYKVGHIFQYPQGTEAIYSNFTPRSNKLAPVAQGVLIDKVVFTGLNVFIKEHLVENFNKYFFAAPKEQVLEEYRQMTANALGAAINVDHISALHDLGYLPLHIKALPEGTLVPMGVPMFTITNTIPEFFWLVNYLETTLSAAIWKPSTTATIAYSYRKILEKYARKTGSPLEFVDWQGHDFSMRGMSGVADAANCGIGHLLSFLGTDTVPAIKRIEKYLDGKNTFVGGSVPATEHSVMCAGGAEDERETIRRLIQDIYPEGIVSIVSDTWDYWNTITVIAPSLKEEIFARKPNALGIAKVVFRPDSGDPVKIICGDLMAEPGTPEYKGTVQCLWELFGGTVTSEGYRVLNERIGVIYGDSITLERAENILASLADKGFASCNIVFGIGSYTYQYLTRDTFGFAMKATAAVINGEHKELFKDPKTGSGKKSAKGYLRVEKDGDTIKLVDGVEPGQDGGLMQTVYLAVDGKVFVKDLTLEKIRTTLRSQK